MTCKTCESDKARANGECAACGMYRRRHNTERPERLILANNWRHVERTR